MRKNLPELPRWLEAQGRYAEAEALMQSIEKDVGKTSALPAPAAALSTPYLNAAAMFRPPILQRLLVGSWVLITVNTLIFGFVIFLPQFFLRQGLTITNSLGYTVVLAGASLVGCAIGAVLSDSIGCRPSIIGASLLTTVAGWFYAHSNAASDPVTVLSIGAILLIAIYIQIAILFGVYTPELFPTEI